MTIVHRIAAPTGRRGRLWRSLGAMVLFAATGCGGPQPTTQPTQKDSGQAAGKADRPPPADVPPSDDRSDLTELPGRVHVVQPGETLYSITTKYYGDGRQWRRILVANRNRLTDPKDLRTGMKLIVP